MTPTTAVKRQLEASAKPQPTAAEVALGIADICDKEAWKQAEAELSELEAHPGDPDKLSRARERVEHYRFFWRDRQRPVTLPDRLRRINLANQEFWKPKRREK